MFLLTSLDKTNYDELVTIIPKQSLESDIDKIPYKSTASRVSRWRCNTTNIMSLGPQPQKAVHKKELVDIKTTFLKEDVTTMILNNTNKKIMTVIKQLPQKVRNNY